MIEIRNLSKRYKNHIVFENVNLNINSGEIIYLKGINGSGKSTLFKMICGIESPSSGEIKIDQGTTIGALIENPSFIENENVKYNLTFLSMLTKKYDINKIKELCRFFELDFDSKIPLKKYSVGMRQKVGIIQAVMENQNLILFDEPVRGLDEYAIQQFIVLIKQLHDKDKTIIIVSHEPIKGIHFTRELLIQDKLILEKSNG